MSKNLVSEICQLLAKYPEVSATPECMVNNFVEECRNFKPAPAPVPFMARPSKYSFNGRSFTAPCEPRKLARHIAAEVGLSVGRLFGDARKNGYRIKIGLAASFEYQTMPLTKADKAILFRCAMATKKAMPTFRVITTAMPSKPDPYSIYIWAMRSGYSQPIICIGIPAINQ